MRTLSIDIGTNSTLYLIAEIEDGNLQVVERGISGNRLGADKREDGSLSSDLIEDNRQILLKILRHGEDLGCDAVKAVGTHALRTAANADAFMAMTNSIGLNFQIIDGEHEAALAWRGVVGKTPPLQQTAILDIGGGSSELIVGLGSEIEFSSSIPIGAVTVSKWFSSDPIPENEILQAQKILRELLTPWKNRTFSDCHLIGIAGTCTSLVSVAQRIIDYYPGVIEGRRFPKSWLRTWKNRLVKMPLEQRLTLPGMPPARAGILPAGALILDVALSVLGKQKLFVSEKGLIFGLAYQMAAERL